MRYLFVSTLLLTGCVSTDTTDIINTIKLSSKAYQAKPENCVIDVITQRPDKKFKELVLLETRVKLKTIMPDIKKKACLAGGDALIINSYETNLIPITHEDFIIGHTQHTFINAIVIKYLK